MLTEGKGEDEQGEEVEDEEESEKEEPLKKKGKVIITKPTKPSTTVLIKMSRKKANKGGGDITFNRRPPILQDRPKELNYGVGITNFKALKYEAKIVEEKKQIEDMVIDKMGQ